MRLTEVVNNSPRRCKQSSLSQRLTQCVAGRSVRSSKTRRMPITSPFNYVLQRWFQPTFCLIGPSYIQPALWSSPPMFLHSMDVSISQMPSLLAASPSSCWQEPARSNLLDSTMSPSLGSPPKRCLMVTCWLWSILLALKRIFFKILVRYKCCSIGGNG